MPTFVHGSNSDIAVDGTNISDKVDSVSHDRTVDTAETSAFGDDDKTFIAGLEDGSFSLAGHWDTTGDGVIDACFDGAVVALIYGPAGSAGGAIKYSCNALITNYSITSSVSDRVNWSVSLQRTAGLTRGTY
jgi:hypothetical protein